MRENNEHTDVLNDFGLEEVLNSFGCPECSKTFKIEDIIKNMENPSEFKFVCTGCGTKFNVKATLFEVTLPNR